MKQEFLPDMPYLNTPFPYNEKKIEKSTRNLRDHYFVLLVMVTLRKRN